MPERVTHWFFPGGYPGQGDVLFCPEYAMPDDVIDREPDRVTCIECLEWLHA